MMSETNDTEQRRTLRAVLGAMTLCMVLFGVLVYLYPEILGLDEFTSEFLAAGYLLVGLSVFFLLRYWRHLFEKRR